MGLLNTLINGNMYDFTSIKLLPSVLAAPILERFTAISYELALEPGEVRGRGSKVYGTTRGQFSASGSMTVYAEDFEILKGGLMAQATPKAAGFMEKRFLLNVGYAELPPAAPILDILRGCRITRVSKPYQQGNEPLKVDLDLHIMDVWLNGVPAVIDGSGAIPSI